MLAGIAVGTSEIGFTEYGAQPIIRHFLEPARPTD